METKFACVAVKNGDVSVLYVGSYQHCRLEGFEHLLHTDGITFQNLHSFDSKDIAEFTYRDNKYIVSVSEVLDEDD